MKHKKHLLCILSILSINSYAAQLESQLSLNTTKPTIMYVCGGNSGRSVMAEWYTRKNYNSLVAEFSRGSGIDPNDIQTPEEFAESIIITTNEATKSELALQRPTAATIQDINAATVVLTMTTAHKNRLLNLIDRECQQSNIDSRDLSDKSKQQWLLMCQNKSLLKNKIYTLSECATGKYKEVPDAYQQNYNFYLNVQTIIADYTDTIMKNYQKTKIFCKIPK